MLRGIGNKKLGLLFSSVFVLVVWNLSDYAVFGEDYGPGISRDPTKESLITQSSDKVDYFIRKKLKQIASKGAELQGEVKPSAPLSSNSMSQTDSENKIQVYIHVHTLGPDVKSILESYGAIVEIINENLKIIQAWIPQDQLYEIAQLSFVKRISEPTYGVPHHSNKSSAHGSPLSGGVTTEGDAILRADVLRAAGLDGRGAKVGVITDGVTSRATSIASGDLPANINNNIYLREGSGDEGTALLEIIYDIAPGAELGFCGASTSLEMIDCVNDLADVFGADIIVDDLSFFIEPYFEDGPVAQAVKNILPNRVYVSGAGNSGKQHYTGNFKGINTLGITKNGVAVSEHNFRLPSGAAADPTLDVTVSPGEPFAIFLQWNDPFGGSINDYDLYFLDSSNSIRYRSEAVQDGSNDPLEWLGAEVIGDLPLTGKIVVTKVSGEDRQIKLIIYGPVVLSEYAISAGSIFGHAAVSGVLATGAIDAADPGNDTIEDSSSQGPVEIFFPSPETRQKPDVTAIDGVSITGAGGFPSPFYGTSAAAPHVAGVAALLIGGGASPAEVIQGIKDSAVDLGSAGFDTIFGYGRVDAFAAAEVLNVLPKPPKPKNDDGKGSAGTCFISTVQ